MSTVAGNKTYSDTMREHVQDYIDAGKPWPATARTIALWLYETGRWRPQRSLAILRCAQDLSKAMREDYITDAQGRRVRAKHAATVLLGEEQLTLWDDIRTAKKEHMQIAFQQRRQQIVGDCKQLKTDVDSFNDNNNQGSFIQLTLNFTNDVAEAEAVSRTADDDDGFTEELRKRKPR